MKTFSPKTLSFLLHLFFLGLFSLLNITQFKSTTEKTYVPVVFNAPSGQANIKEISKESTVRLKSVNKEQAQKSAGREVFGLNRNSYTDSSSSGSGMEVKMGNTTAKASDNERLRPSDGDSLPAPTEEYLVSQMPRVLSEVQPIYPKIAREKQMEGVVVLDVLIDELGNVRQVTVIESEEVFKAAAIEAMKKFKFTPANVNGLAVAVKIRYVIRFKLEF